MFYKYLQLAKTSWQNGFVYRLNFTMWRVRVVLQLLAVYFLWVAVLQNSSGVFNYSRSELLTYILGTSIIRSLVFSSRSIDAQSEISTGDLNNYLVKPLNYFANWFSRDLADKLLNILFGVVELGLFILLFAPPLFVQGSVVQWLMFIAASLMAMLLYFYFSFLISMTTFWLPEANGWPQRFFVFMILEFIAGGLFPLDILPAPLFKAIQFLPTSYFLHVPLQIYLGRLTGLAALGSLAVTVLWIVIFSQFAHWVFKQGLKVYGAYGR